MRRITVELWQLIDIAPLIFSIEPQSKTESLVSIRFRKSKKFYQNKHYKLLDFFAKNFVMVELWVYRNIKRVFPKFSRNLVFDVQMLRQFHDLILPDSVFEDAEAVVPVPVDQLKKAVHLLTYYKYKYSENESKAMYQEGERILSVFYSERGG